MPFHRLAASRLLPIGMMLVAMVSVQSGASLAKGLFPRIGAEGATTLRLAISAVIMTAVWRPWKIRLTRANAGPLIGYGLALGTMNLTFYLALRTIPLGVAVAIEFVGPLTVALVQSRRKIDFLWVALAVGGLVLLLPIGRLSIGLDPIGVGFALIAGVCWALYIVFGQKAGSLHGGRTVAAGALIAAVLVVPFGIARAGPSLLNAAVLPVGLLVALLSSAIPYSLEMFALTRMPTRIFGTLMSLEPAVGALAAFMIIGERLSPIQVIAIALVISASVGTVMAGERKATQVEMLT
jgi:inner membrane transporter RhtA